MDKAENDSKRQDDDPARKYARDFYASRKDISFKKISPSPIADSKISRQKSLTQLNNRSINDRKVKQNNNHNKNRGSEFSYRTIRFKKPNEFNLGTDSDDDAMKMINSTQNDEEEINSQVSTSALNDNLISIEASKFEDINNYVKVKSPAVKSYHHDNFSKVDVVNYPQIQRVSVIDIDKTVHSSINIESANIELTENNRQSSGKYIKSASRILTSARDSIKTVRQSSAAWIRNTSTMIDSSSYFQAKTYLKSEPSFTLRFRRNNTNNTINLSESNNTNNIVKKSKRSVSRKKFKILKQYLYDFISPQPFFCTNIPLQKILKKMKLKGHHINKMKYIFMELDIDDQNEILMSSFLQFLQEERSIFIDKLLSTVQMQELEYVNFESFLRFFVVFCSYSKEDLMSFCCSMIGEDCKGVLFEELTTCLKKYGYIFISNYEKTLQELNDSQDQELNLPQFKKLITEYSLVLHPVMRIQEKLRRKTLGIKVWEKYSSLNKSRLHGTTTTAAVELFDL